MKYMMLVYDNEKAMEGKSPEEMEEFVGAWSQYTEDFQKSGKMLAGEALQPTSTATTVRATESRTITSDGPFAETKEQLGGFFIVDADDLDEAIERAAKMPHIACGGTVEVRPVMEMH